MKPNYKTIAEALEQLRFCEYKDKHHGHPLEMNAAFQYLEKRAEKEPEAIAEIEQLRSQLEKERKDKRVQAEFIGMFNVRIGLIEYLNDSLKQFSKELLENRALFLEQRNEIERLQRDKVELVEALKRILWLMDEKQLVESEPSHCGPLLLDEARMILAKHGGEPK